MASKRPVSICYSTLRVRKLMDHRVDAVFTRGGAFKARSVRPGWGSRFLISGASTMDRPKKCGDIDYQFQAAE